VINKLATVVGGYVAARLAPCEPYLNAGVLAGIGIDLGFLFLGAQAFLEKALSFQGGKLRPGGYSRAPGHVLR
jgi:hypothetical protein